MPKYFLSAHAIPHMNLFGLEKTLRSLFRYTLAMNICLAVVTISLLAVSLVSMNTSTEAGYTTNILKEQQKTLAEQNAALSAELANLQAMDAVSARVQNLQLTKINAIDYISEAKTSVAYLK